MRPSHNEVQMLFKTRYTSKDFKKVYEKIDPTVKVERAGYVSAQTRIENLLMAGQRLQQFRSENYDFTGRPIDEDYEDPTRRPGYDMADAFQDAINIKSRLKSRKEKMKDQNAVKVQNDEKTVTPPELKTQE